jgi:hypothetical protein
MLASLITAEVLSPLTVWAGLNKQNGQNRDQNSKQADHRDGYSHAEFGRSNWLCNLTCFVQLLLEYNWCFL